MNKNALIGILMALLIVNAVASLWFSFQFGRYLGRVQGLSVVRNQITKNTSIFQALVNDTMEYSKKNPAIVPVLQNPTPRPQTTSSPAAPKSVK
ncbi:MAG TPA: hypothetical protein P5186_02550 [Candidatus Paceibacterota bacterium]|nr:hypothetical protein [Verrucomicrobiota bacterium]HRY46903.1 hypothetical protein [Candidatus Paceibacterota bacterium]HRZ99404.1 hypothetical protein [Candidatus Paceibacterota bacterium]